MGGFPDYLRMILGWWSGRTAEPVGANLPAAFLFVEPGAGFTFEAPVPGFLYVPEGT